MAQTNANLIWKIADLLRGPYQPNQYRRCDLAVHHPAPFGLHPGADQGPSPRRVQEGAEPEDRPRCCAQVHVQVAQVVVVVVLATASAKARRTAVAEAVCMALAAVALVAPQLRVTPLCGRAAMAARAWSGCDG